MVKQGILVNITTCREIGWNIDVTTNPAVRTSAAWTVSSMNLANLMINLAHTKSQSVKVRMNWTPKRSCVYAYSPFVQVRNYPLDWPLTVNPCVCQQDQLSCSGAGKLTLVSEDTAGNNYLLQQWVTDKGEPPERKDEIVEEIAKWNR